MTTHPSLALALAIALAGAVPGQASGQDVAAVPAATVTDALPGPAAGTADLPLDGAEVTLSEFLWTARPVIVFANTAEDPSFQRQMDLLRERPDALADRDVVVIVDTDPDALSDLRRNLRPRGFSLVIVDKDGTVVQRKPAPWTVREITHAIDRLPLRRQEIRERGLTR
jgi:hypothetical protein